MTAKKSFFILLKIFFVLYSLEFIKEAFYVWDGYSFYLRFTDFLPDLSLTFIVWTILEIIQVIILFFIAYVFYKILSGFLKNIRFEHFVAWFICILVIKKGMAFFAATLLEGISLTGAYYFLSLIIIAVFTAFVVWLVRKNTGNILNILDVRLRPLVWIFVLFLVLSVPLSFFKKGTAVYKYINDEKADIFHKTGEGGFHSDTEVAGRPNIILIVMDALTARDMQIYGYDRPTTPFISEWSREAVVFKRAYASSNWTTPSTMSLFTGQRPWTHKIWYRAFYNPVSNYDENLVNVLSDHGYFVYSFVQNHFAHPETLGIKAFLTKDRAETFWLLNRWCFDRHEKFSRPVVSKWILESNAVFKLINSFCPPNYKTIWPPEVVYDRFLNFVSQSQSTVSLQQPFFVWLHVFPPHDPYLPPEPYIGKFGDAERFVSDREQGAIYQGAYNPEQQGDVDILRKRYDELILYSDQQFKLFLSRLAKTVDMSNTVIILTSDHGESFSNEYKAHDGPHLYEPLVHVPLIIKMPEGTDSGVGAVEEKSADMPVEQIDLAPTILDIAGLPAPAWMEGRSLLPLLEGKSLEPRPVFSMQLIKNRSFGHPITRGTIAVWDGDNKLVQYLGEDETLLFNLKSDPEENVNISKQSPEVMQSLMGLINDNLSDANARITQSNSIR